MSCGDWCELPKFDQVDETHLDRYMCDGLLGHHKCSTPCLRVTSIGNGVPEAFSPNAQLWTETNKVSKVVGGGRKSKVLTLISFIDSVSVETCGAEPLVKWQRTTSRACMSGREMATRSERMKAQKRRTMPGRKKARAAMRVVSDQEPWTSCLEQGTIYMT
jgi:hypothetical protein